MTVDLSADRAVIEAARSVFRAVGMRERIERMSDLKRAVEALDLEEIAAAADEPDIETLFIQTLLRLGQGGARAANIYRRRYNRVIDLAHAAPEDVHDIPGAGPMVLAAWKTALDHLQVDSIWAGRIHPNGGNPYAGMVLNALD